MSFVVKGLPDLKTLKEQLKEEKWIKHYSKYGGFTGSLKAIQYLSEKLKTKKDE